MSLVPANLVGQKFGRLTVVESLRMTKSGQIWLCQCDCGGTCERLTTNLKKPRNGGCKLCESARRAAVHITHGGSAGGFKTKLFMVWKGIRSRCRDVGNTSWRYYGAKNIGVCSEWDDFAVFRDWALANGYREGLSIDRLDPTKDYSPSNCEWVSRGENSRRRTAYYRSLSA